MEIFIALPLIALLVFLVVRNNRKRLAASRTTVVPTLPAYAPRPEPNRPLIDRLLTELKAEMQIDTVDCPICERRLYRVNALCGMTLLFRVLLCRGCKKGMTQHSDKELLPCHLALQKAIDDKRNKLTADLAKEQTRLQTAQEALADEDSSRLFPDHRTEMEHSCGEIQSRINRINDGIGKLGARIVEDVATRLADDWHRQRREPVLADDGPYRSTPLP